MESIIYSIQFKSKITTFLWEANYALVHHQQIVYKMLNLNLCNHPLSLLDPLLILHYNQDLVAPLFKKSTIEAYLMV